MAHIRYLYDKDPDWKEVADNLLSQDKVSRYA